MAYKRKFTKKAFSKRKRAKKAAPKSMKKLRATIGRVLSQKMETKYTNSDIVKTELYHNVYTSLGDPFAKSYPSEGTGDDERIGDKIMQRGLKIRMLIGQKYDRPNVTFKLWLLKLPRALPLTTYSTMFDLQTNNVLLDSVNPDACKVVWSKTIHKNYPNVAAPVPGTIETREITFPVSTYIKRQRNITFTLNGGFDQGYSDGDYNLIIAAYDAYGTLNTDNIGYVQTFLRYYYKDP